jgi:ornithine cyclodeaminase
MGSDAEDKQELYSEVFLKANCLVCDSRSQSFRLGEYHHGLEDKTIRLEDQVIELGELVSKMKVGRRSADDITICDLTGTGMQDTIIASIAYKKASDLGMGLDIDS